MPVRITALAAAALVSVAACADDPQPGASFSEKQREEIGEIVRAYLLENPTILEEMIGELERAHAAQEDAAAEIAVAAIVANKDTRAQIFDNPMDFSIGAADAEVTIVEFFDYNCGACRSAAAWSSAALETYGDKVRFVFKEAPIFADNNDSSGLAARAALAAVDQGEQYTAFHFGLMTARGQLTQERIKELAEEAGLNWSALKERMDKPEIQQHLDANLDLLAQTGRLATPLFLVNDTPVLGFNGFELERLINETLGE